MDERHLRAASIGAHRETSVKFYGMTNGIFVSLFNFVHVLTVSYVYKTQKMPAHWCIYKFMFYIYLIKYLFNISEYKAMLIQLLIYHINIDILYVYMYIYMYVCVYIYIYIYI